MRFPLKICPLCLMNRENKLEAQLRRVLAATNKDEHAEAVVYLQAMVYDGGPEPTLCEDYHIGMSERDGVLVIEYACACGECGFKFHHEFKIGARLVSSWTEAEQKAAAERSKNGD